MNFEKSSAKRNSSDWRFPAILREIRERICLVKYPPGDVISENALASEFGVSRTLVQRVLQRLEFEGLVVRKGGVGTIVTTHDIKSLRQLFVVFVKLSELIGDPSFGVQVGDDNVGKFEDLLERCKQLRGERNQDEIARILVAFHEAQMGLHDSHLLSELLDRPFYQTLRVWLTILGGMEWVEEVDDLADEIENTIQVLRCGDLALMGKVRRDSILQWMDRVMRYLGAAV